MERKEYNAEGKTSVKNQALFQLCFTKFSTQH
jgi:hypothetical protein